MTEGQRDKGAELQETMRPVIAAVQAFAEAFGRSVNAWLERNRPVIEALAKLAADPRVQARIEAYERGEIRLPRPCHCLCGRAHPDGKGICDGDAVTARRYETARLGPVDVALCAPCAVAQGIAALTQERP